MNTKKIDDLLLQINSESIKLKKILLENGVELDSEKEKKYYFTTDCDSLKNLKVAGIMDDFTVGNFRDECNLLELECDKYREQMREFKPDLLFVESAWNGKNKSWYKKIANGSKELLDLTDYARENSIPVVFWNKEDPVWTDTFMSAASCADFVFTTDFDCIERYKRTLGHNNVYYLPFSAQPRVHNPIEIHDRKDKFCFAGAYYHRYKDRCKVFDSFADVFESKKGFEIYDRNLGNESPEHAFPSRYKSMIVGTLKPDDIHIAYKGYNYGVNMNSVTQSQAMFARRVYELLASNTVCVGNYSRGVRNLFGDLTAATDSAAELDRHLTEFCGDDVSYRKYRLQGLRKVISKNLCEDRLGFICSCVYGKDLRKKPITVNLFAFPSDKTELERVKESFEKQSYDKKKLYIVTDEKNNDTENIKYIRSADEVTLCDDEFYGILSANNYYGENYILDLALADRYAFFGDSGEKCIGFTKSAFYKNDGGYTLENKDSAYKYTTDAMSDRSIVKGKYFTFKDKQNGCLFGIDEFNFCENETGEKCEVVDDMKIVDTGIELERINKIAEGIDVEQIHADSYRISPKDIFALAKQKIKGITTRLDGSNFVISSSLKPNDVKYIILKKKFTLAEIYADGGEISLTFNSTGDLDIENRCTFYDGTSKELGIAKSVGSATSHFKVPENSAYAMISFRVKGSGSREINSIVTGNIIGGMNYYLSRSDVLEVANHYPSYDDLYRYMFVHRRNLGYKRHGEFVDMALINMYEQPYFSEFQGINVTHGNADTLSACLESGTIKTVVVHFMDRYIWSVVKGFLAEIRLVIFSHGSDIQPYERRAYNYTTDAAREKAMKESDERRELWDEIFKFSEEYDINFVYVSNYFGSQVEEDYNVSLGERKNIIHNFIDSSLFTYEPKKADDRFKIMSVKSFSGLTYANDVTQEAILLLSKEKEFDKMEFDIFGDGDRFDTDTGKLTKFKNVHLHRGFMTQEKIAEEHKKHGIYIATTRMDTQGVSRDEAMSSGLVPVTNRVAAIPEFTDDTCACVCEPEDARAVADAILSLVRDEKKFLSMSEAAAKRVRSQSNEEKTIGKECKLIFKK